jgi:acetyl-CoA carboxylase carboxyl transferase subunit alpha
LWRYFLELHGDRGFKDDKAMIGGLGKLVVSLYDGQQKDITRRPVNTETSGWQIQKDIESAALDENGSIPVLTLIDTPGAYPGLEAEERGQGEAIARNIFEMVRLKVPIITIVVKVLQVVH